MNSSEKFDFNRSDWINLSQSLNFTNWIHELDQVSPDEILPVTMNILISKCSIHVPLKRPKEARKNKFQKERRVNEEHVAVSKIKVDPKHFFRYAKRYSICKREVGPRFNPLTDNKYEMCCLLVNEFNSVFTKPKQTSVIKDPVPLFLSHTTREDDYRPISLTSVLSEVIEKNIRQQVLTFLSHRGYLNNTQHGFRSGRSCLSALLDVYDNIMHMINNKSIIHMIYLDFSKAFDKVDHGILLHKLRDLDITDRLGLWFFHFLNNMHHYVRMPGGISQPHPVLSGVTQGTVLGPLLFLIMIINIDKGIFPSSKLVSFVDDTRVYSCINAIEKCNQFQIYLNSIYEWAHVNNMFFNAQQFNDVSFNGSMTPCGSNVYNKPNMEIISPSINVLDLGIYMSGDCTFNYHISSFSKKCANLSGWILRRFYTRDCITMLTLFKSIVLSRLNYGSQLWSPFLIKHITQLEKIQRSFTKHITGMNDMPYHERLKSLTLYSLQRRRERHCIIYIWKIIEGLAPNFSNQVASTLSGRRGRSYVISHVNVGRIGTLFYNSFRWRSIRLFNSLPMHLRSISSC